LGIFCQARWSQGCSADALGREESLTLLAKLVEAGIPE
jgi:hypothetical protein